MNLTPSLEAKIEQMMATGDYDDPEAVLTDALRLREERGRRRVRLLELLAEGEEDELNGNVVELTPELWEEIWQAARRRAQADERPSADVWPGVA
jgi:putative addiction module CopG family antidote